MSVIRLAIQKSGRLTEASRALVAECGIELEPMGASLRTLASNFPVEVLQNVLSERDSNSRVVASLGVALHEMFQANLYHIERIFVGFEIRLL